MLSACTLIISRARAGITGMEADRSQFLSVEDKGDGAMALGVSDADDFKEATQTEAEKLRAGTGGRCSRKGDMLLGPRSGNRAEGKGVERRPEPLRPLKTSGVRSKGGARADPPGGESARAVNGDVGGACKRRGDTSRRAESGTPAGNVSR